MKREGVLLVSGAGFLGSAVSKELADSGWEVQVLARRTIPGLRDGVHYHRGLQGEATVLSPLLEKCSAVVHLAATGTPASLTASFLGEANESLLPCSQLFGAMEKTPPERILFISSGGSNLW